MGSFAFSDPEMRMIREEAANQGIPVRELLRRADAAYPADQLRPAQWEGQE
ncbi:MAG: hypothetical protein U0931_35955 [Vulcanimicrobiota bacterium]